MKIFQVNKETGRKMTAFDSNFILSHITQTEKAARIVCMHLEENGVIGYHQAAMPQLLLIISGESFVRGNDDEYLKVHHGDAVFWEKDEWHETKTKTGLTAIVIESDELNTSALMLK